MSTYVPNDLSSAPVRFWAGIYAVDGFVFCQMHLERDALRNANPRWTLLDELHQAENEPSIVFQARIDAVMDRLSRESDLRLTHVRLQSRDCYRRLQVGRMMEEMMMG